MRKRFSLKESERERERERTLLTLVSLTEVFSREESQMGSL